MKKILEKIYEDFPELKNDKEKVNKLVYFLNENKPNIEVSNEFKLNLKNRIDSYIWLKQKKKNNFLIFALPVFSFCFVFLGVFYYLWLDKIDDKNLVSITTYNDESLIYDTPQISRMMVFDFDENESIEENINLLLDNENSLEIISNDSFVNITEEKDINNYKKQDDSKHLNLEQEYHNNTDDLKNDESKINENFYNNDDKKIAFDDWNNDDYSWWESMMLMSVFMDASFYEETSFNDYCDQNSWKIIEYISENNEKLYKCIIEEKTCLEEKYENWYCEFEEK